MLLVRENRYEVADDPTAPQGVGPPPSARASVCRRVVRRIVVHALTRGLVGGVLDGYNSSVFAYGATGAGKTFTMLGSLEHPGVMVNTLHDLFEMMKDAKMQDAKFKVTLSYMEIYNELIKDLLQVPGLPLIAVDCRRLRADQGSAVGVIPLDCP